MAIQRVLWVVLAMATVSLSCVQAQQAGSEMRVQEERLGTVPDDRLHERVTWHAKHIAWIMRRGAKSMVVVDGREGPEYDEIYVRIPRTFALDTVEDGKLVSKEIPIKPDESDISWLSWSRNGERLAYVARHADKWFAVIDGKEDPAYDEVRLPEFTEDNLHVVYQAKRADKSFLVLDGRQSSAYDGWAGGPWFSKNGGRVACVAIRDGKQIPLVDGEEGDPHDEIRRIVFSRDNERVGCIVVDGNKYSVVADGKPGPAYNWIGGLAAVWSSVPTANVSRIEP